MSESINSAKTLTDILIGGVVLHVAQTYGNTATETSIWFETPTPCRLHWGLRQHGRSVWQIPPEAAWPKNTTRFDNKALQTDLSSATPGQEVVIRLDLSLSFSAFSAIEFVLYFPKEKRWENNGGRNYTILLPGSKEQVLEPSNLADKIVDREMASDSWTLMHRFDLCFDLLDGLFERAIDREEELAIIFVWLRFSALRQLDWQRNYNTKPRELSHSLDRLTRKLAGLYVQYPDARQMVRYIMPNLGRGGDGQRVRDEILHIMHRHHIKEVAGRFMEQWHQKLHNNTTPDDVVICEAYLEFLRSNGNLTRFYEWLELGHVTRARLNSFERPITNEPDFIPRLKEGLIRDFQNFLGILKSVHSATDLETSINAARPFFCADLRAMIDFIWRNRQAQADRFIEVAGKITGSRKLLQDKMRGQGDVRELLLLDLSLEEFLRVLVERNLNAQLAPDLLAGLIGIVAENLLLSCHDENLACCLRHWNLLNTSLSPVTRWSTQWAIQAKSVIERLSHAVGAFVDWCQRVLQPKAEILGRAFLAEEWSIKLFAEEVARGGLEFLLSTLLRRISPILRKHAHMGNWQVVSRGHGQGNVQVVATLADVLGPNEQTQIAQEKMEGQGRVVVTDKVVGNEEIPAFVIAVLTPDDTDIVSHVAIRARNANVLFATCYDLAIIEHLKSLRGQWIALQTTPAGDVAYEVVSGDLVREARPSSTNIGAANSLQRICVPEPVLRTYALSQDEFAAGGVGGKSNNLTSLRGLLPDWIGLPPSVALPFGSFEKVLSDEVNSQTLQRYGQLVRLLDEAGEISGQSDPYSYLKLLTAIREAVLLMRPPHGLVDNLHAVMDKTGLRWPADWEVAWTCIKRVWASKWNERACMSRRARQIQDRDIYMAVLIQDMIEAQYSFVIHTVNPLTGNKDELYAELVLGLGEPLVGNYPGRALSFVCAKGENKPEVTAFPSKSEGLFGSGLIFRSDSNGEDLTDYAGAGLYDSVTLEPVRHMILDYSKEPLLADPDYRDQILSRIAQIGVAVENSAEYPQDIEGVYSKGRFYVVQTRPQVGMGMRDHREQ